MKNGNRILTCALALSLAVHAIFAFVFRPIRSVDAHPEQTPMPIRVFIIHTPPPPTPTPAPTVAPKTRPRHTVAVIPVHVPHTINRPGPRASSEPIAVPGPSDAPYMPPQTPGPTGSPETTATPKPACSAPNVPASAVNVVSPSIPQSADYVGESQAQVRVTLQPSGAIQAVEIYRTAGNRMLDNEALRAARQSTYRAEIRDCVAVAGEYLFTVDFKE